MPNWCDNTVTITGTQEKIAEIRSAVSRYLDECYGESDTITGKGFLTYCLPEPDYTKVPVKETYPKEGETNEAAIRTDSWWDWRVQNWGTKWEVEAQIVNADDDLQLIRLIFNSAWSPPVKAYAALFKQEGITSVSALYYEPSMDFAGSFEDGVEELILLSALTLSDIESKDVVGELEASFDIYNDIMLSNPLQLHPEYEGVLKGLGISDCREMDSENVEAIYQILKGKDIQQGSIEVKEGKFGSPDRFMFDNTEYSL